jgi:uncharacterized damage-inducible protein DinB
MERGSGRLAAQLKEHTMYRRIDDFLADWAHHSAGTARVLAALTDPSLTQSVGSDHRTLGRIAWHTVGTIPEMLGRVGLKIEGPSHEAPVPATAAEIALAYNRAAQSVTDLVKKHWTDATLEQEDDMYGEKWKRGITLQALMYHETHHRGQMTVLMRQAGLVVPGVFGPAQEEWSQYGMPAPAI